MNVTLLCSDRRHPVMPHLRAWAKLNGKALNVSLVDDIHDVVGGEILFLISCSQKIEKADRDKFKKVLVIHASDLPTGRGWSPHVWSIVGGADHLVVTLLEAEDTIDSGDIWHKLTIDIPSHFLSDEINEALFSAEIELIDFAVANFETIRPEAQDSTQKVTYHRKRTPDDSEISIDMPLGEQFDLIRVCDPERFPAHFRFRGHTYKITLEKLYE
ncbi:UDP-glucuronic acid dehydrogenase [Tsuneonella suprasediminis]|uniref:UDP-glucuronic acid dehydrogenase n=2 Tax=Tsuneonella suprasediminis TaxID=2306996 RepID=A0A419QY27_9SPHN|nr:UDP-glucuronic acid dehydrogenase [Tsuneonella suprasediminis]